MNEKQTKKIFNKRACFNSVPEKNRVVKTFRYQDVDLILK